MNDKNNYIMVPQSASTRFFCGKRLWMEDTLRRKKYLDKNLEENRLDVGSLNTGVYLYRVKRINGLSYNGKLIIE